MELDQSMEGGWGSVCLEMGSRERADLDSVSKAVAWGRLQGL